VENASTLHARELLTPIVTEEPRLSTPFLPACRLLSIRRRSIFPLDIPIAIRSSYEGSGDQARH
jgi:hypothetical protein